MKHIFYVHSAINFLLAKQFVTSRNIDPKTCLFLYDRVAYFEPDVFPSERFPHMPQPASQSFKPEWLFFKTWQRIWKFNRQITQLSEGQPFVFYSTFSWGNFFYLMLKHTLCTGYGFIEDGTASLNPHGYLKIEKRGGWLKKALFWLNFGANVPVNKHFIDTRPDGFLGLISSSIYSFPGYEGACVVGLPKGKHLPEFDDQYILVLDGTVDFAQAKLENYLSMFVQLLSELQRLGIKKVYYKFPPSSKIIKEPVKNLISASQNIEFVELDAGVILEMIAVGSSATFLIDVSSVGFYAYLAGRRVVTYHNLLEKLELNHQINTNQPKEYLQHLEYIENL